MVAPSNVLDRVLVLEMVRVTEAAAVAASSWSGAATRKRADHAAVEAMREALNHLDSDGTVVIGEGERDEAPMLFIGERSVAHRGTGRASTSRSIRWKAPPSPPRPGPNALAVLAIAEEGGLLNAPDVYMDKLRSGRAIPRA
jgi:fructose-1,6-bisphosphatase II / sedoheptulose-1,7-bisphosphatase